MAKTLKSPKKIADLPTSRRHIAIVMELDDEKQTDRAVAIVGAAYVDLVLRDAITFRLLPDEKLLSELFEDRGPLQDFGARITMAFALQIIGPAARTDFKAIKNIRNAFAHSADAISFDREDVAGLCKSLWYPQNIQFHKRPKPTTPRGLYIRAVALLTQLLNEDLGRRQHGMPDLSGELLAAPRP
jgi:hypothetical protein